MRAGFEINDELPYTIVDTDLSGGKRRAERNGERLDIYQMDFHYHAGQERGARTLREHLEHAEITGRALLGLTDHYNKYTQEARPQFRPVYEPSMKGLRDYYNEMESLKSEFPAIKLYFAPEIGSNTDLRTIPDEAIALADYFICEPPGVNGTLAENTEKLLERLNAVAAFSARVQRPVFLAHPFRSPVNFRLVKNPITPAVTAMGRRGSFRDYEAREVSDFFLFDVVRLGREAAKLGIPLEINGVTHNRIRMVNLAGPLLMLWAAYAMMQEQGASFVPGSDQHGFETGSHGAYVPFDCFDALGITPADITFMAGR